MKRLLLVSLLIATTIRASDFQIIHIDYFSTDQQDNTITLIPSGLEIGEVYAIEVSTNLIDWSTVRAFMATNTIDWSTVDFPLNEYYTNAFFRVKYIPHHQL